MLFIVSIGLLFVFFDLFPDKILRLSAFLPLIILLIINIFDEYIIYISFTILILSFAAFLFLFLKKKTLVNVLKISFFLSFIFIGVIKILHLAFDKEFVIIFHLISFFWLLFEIVISFPKIEKFFQRLSQISFFIGGTLIIFSSLLESLKMESFFIYGLLGSSFIIFALIPKIIVGLYQIGEEEEVVEEEEME